LSNQDSTHPLFPRPDLETSGNEIVSEWLALLAALRGRPTKSEAEAEHGILVMPDPELPGREIRVVLSRGAFARAYERLNDVASLVEGYELDPEGTRQALVRADLFEHLKSSNGSAVEMHFTSLGRWSIVRSSSIE